MEFSSHIKENDKGWNPYGDFLINPIVLTCHYIKDIWCQLLWISRRRRLGSFLGFLGYWIRSILGLILTKCEHLYRTHKHNIALILRGFQAYVNTYSSDEGNNGSLRFPLSLLLTYARSYAGECKTRHDSAWMPHHVIYSNNRKVTRNLMKTKEFSSHIKEKHKGWNPYGDGGLAG